MKVAILAGGVGNRLGGDTAIGPKPMVRVGGHPLLWHIMSHFSAFGFSEFVIAVGYQGDQIKRYFAEFPVAEHDLRVRLKTGQIEIHGQPSDLDWIVDVVDTGVSTASGGRVRHLAPYLEDETFMLTFGDAVSDVNLHSLLELHQTERKLATITAVHPPPRFGELLLDGDQVAEFSEKPMDSGWINGGFMVLEPGALAYIDGDETPLAPDPMQRLAKDGELVAYRHEGFWQHMDSLRDKQLLENLWNSPSPPWKVWE